MTGLIWDKTGERYYEAGVEKGVLYLPDEDGVYSKGVAWNGLITVSEKSSGAEATPIYADNTQYLNLVSREKAGATISAYVSPKEFDACDGSAHPTPGVSINQQGRSTFGLCYRTTIGNDTEGETYGYKLHLIYGCLAAPSARDHQTINESLEPISLSWEITTTPVAVTGLKPTATITIDSTLVDADLLAALEAILYGVDGPPSVDPRLPLPDEIITLMTPAGN